jgi:integrase/recombinase XerD
MDAALVPLPGTALARMAPADVDRLTQVTAAWLASHGSEHTRASYAKDLAQWVAWCERCGIGPLEARMRHVDAWIAFQRENGVRGDGHPAAKTSIARRVSAISSWYAYLIMDTADDDTPLMTRNPARTKARPKINPDYSPTAGLSRQETDRLIAAAEAESAMAAALIKMLLMLGLRCGSAIGAQITDLGYDRGHRTLDLTVKGDEAERVPIPPALGVAIDEMLAARGNPTEGPLFTRHGRPLEEYYVFRLVRRLARKAGIPQAGRLSPHSMRHTAITELLNSGASLRDAQDFAGHKDPRTTRRYDRARASLDRHGAYVLAARFGHQPDGK